MSRIKNLWIVATLLAALLIPEAASANSPVLLTEGFISFENGAPVEYLVAGDQAQLPDGIMLISLAAITAPGSTVTATTTQALSRPVLLSKKVVSKRRLKETNNLKRRRVRSSGRSSVAGEADCFILAHCYDIRNIREDGRPWHYIPGYTTEGGPGPTTITFSISHNVRNNFSSKMGLSAEFVSVEFGFSVEVGWTATWQNTTQVPEDRCRQVRTYAIYQDYKGDVYYKAPFWSHWEYRDWVRSWRFDGIGFKVFKVQCS